MSGNTRSAFALALAVAATGAGCRLHDAAAAPVVSKPPPTAARPTPPPPASTAVAKTRLKAGLWRVEGPEFDTLNEHGKVYLCLDAASTALIDPPPPPRARCRVEDGRPNPDLYLGTTQCRYADRVVTARVRIDGDDLYFRDVLVRRRETRRGEKVSHFAEWVGACQPDQRPGNAYTQAYGEDAMHAAELPSALRTAAGRS